MSTPIRSEYDGDHEVINVRGVRGLLMNKREIDNFRGPIPLSDYPIYDDPNPRVLRKPLDDVYKAKQNITVRFLEPPVQPPPGDIIIQQEVSEALGN